MKRLYPNVISRDITSSHSSRRGARPSLMVLHTTEGIMRLRDRAKFWDNANASAHAGVGAGSEAENSARYVWGDDKAWTQAFYNPVGLSIEIEGFASQHSWERGTVREVARSLAHWREKHNIPLRRAIVLNGRVLRSGVASHKQLGALGGGHS